MMTHDVECMRPLVHLSLLRLPLLLLSAESELEEDAMSREDNERKMNLNEEDAAGAVSKSLNSLLAQLRGQSDCRMLLRGRKKPLKKQPRWRLKSHTQVV